MGNLYAFFFENPNIFSIFGYSVFMAAGVISQSAPVDLLFLIFFFFRELCIVDLEFRCAFHLFMTHIANKHGSSYNESCSM